MPNRNNHRSAGRRCLEQLSLWLPANLTPSAYYSRLRGPTRLQPTGTTPQRLYVAKESVPVRALLGGRVAVPCVTPKWRGVHEGTRGQIPDAPFFIIGRDDDHYAQVYCHDDGSFDLEYRDGSPQQHFSVQGTSDRRLATDALWAWALQDDDRLHNLVPWVRLSLDSQAAWPVKLSSGGPGLDVSGRNHRASCCNGPQSC